MAYSLNRAQVIGNVTRDPEVRQTGSGQTVATFAVATNRTWTDASGQRQERAEFHNVVVWGKLAEIVQQYVKKGQKIFAEGRMQTRDWTGDDGVKRYRMEIVADNVIMLGGGGGAGRTANSGALRSAGAPMGAPMSSSAPMNTGAMKSAGAASNKNEEVVSLDDLPF
jgi:single-strand DNA-binding protein